MPVVRVRAKKLLVCSPEFLVGKQRERRLDDFSMKKL